MGAFRHQNMCTLLGAKMRHTLGAKLQIGSADNNCQVAKNFFDVLKIPTRPPQPEICTTMPNLIPPPSVGKIPSWPDVDRRDKKYRFDAMTSQSNTDRHLRSYRYVRPDKDPSSSSGDDDEGCVLYSCIKC